MSVLNQTLLRFYRKLPAFRGKYRIGYRLFRKLLEQPQPTVVKISKRLIYHLPNSMENIGKEILIKGEYERETVKAIVAELKKTPNPVFFDIGANIGAIAIPVKKKWPATEIHAFEASPATFQFLKKNFEVNNIPTDKISNKVIFASSGQELRFYDSAEFYGKSSLAPMYTKASITVQSISIDDYCRQNNITIIDLVKVDVQGFELEVFKGMGELLRQKKIAALFFEFEDWAEKAAGYEPGDSQEFLLQIGYEIWDEKGARLNDTMKKGSMMLWARPGARG